MQLNKVITVGGSVQMEFLVVTHRHEEEENILTPIVEEYGIDPDFLYIPNLVQLFEGDLSLNVGDVFKLVKTSEGVTV